jgi:hypothetical protein
MIPNFLLNYAEYAATMPEVPMLYNKWAGVMAVAATLGKSFYLKRGHFNVYPNLYVMLIGSPGTGKGVSFGILQGVMQASGYRAFAADRSSKEKFIQDLADGFDFRSDSAENEYESLNWDDAESGGASRECFVMAEEFNDFIGTNNLEFIGLLTKLWSYTGTYSNRLKTGRSVEIFEPCVNLFGGNTHAGFAMAFPPEVLGQGFIARLLLVYGEATGRKVSFPKPPDPARKLELAKQLSSIRAGIRGEAEMPKNTEDLLDEINQSWTGFSDDLRFQHYGSRRFSQLLKLCLIFAAGRFSRTISREDVIDANTLLTDTEDVMGKALGEFGKAKHSDVNSKIMAALYETPKPLSVHDLWKFVSNDLDSISDLAKILQNLAHAEKIQNVNGKGFLPKLKKRTRNSEHARPAEGSGGGASGEA